MSALAVLMKADAFEQVFDVLKSQEVTTTQRSTSGASSSSFPSRLSGQRSQLSQLSALLDIPETRT